MIDECIKECEAAIVPRSIYRIEPCQVEGNAVSIGGLKLQSRYLAKNLNGCEKAVALAATLGPRADFMIRQSAVSGMAKAAVLQSVFAEQIEAYLDSIEAEIRAKTGVKKLRPRFSPGYADLPLETQRDLFAYLEISKRIGVSLTDTCLMVPTKSVTALIGVPNE